MQIDGCLGLMNVLDASQALLRRKASVQAPSRNFPLFRVFFSRELLQLLHPSPYFVFLHAFEIAGRAIDMISIIAEPGWRLSPS